MPDERFDADFVAERLANGIGQVTRIGASTGLRPQESAALANAMKSATGLRLTDLPMSPPRVLAALDAAADAPSGD